MKPRIKLYAVLDTTAHAETLLTNIQTRLIGKSIYASDNLAISSDESNKPTVSFDYRFDSSTDRDDFKEFFSGAFRDSVVTKGWILTGTRLSIHSCTHDDGEGNVKPCSTTSYSLEFSK